jgi:hypothetical protein
VGRKTRRQAAAAKAKAAAGPRTTPTSKQAKTTKDVMAKVASLSPPRPPRPPRSAAAAISIAPGSNITIAEAMKRARRSVDFQSLGIDAQRPKRAVTEGLLLEVPGQESGPKA